MLQSLYTAASGMTGQQYCIDTIANNIANINTAGFKSGRVDFADALYAQIQRPVESGTYLQNGSGMLLGGALRIMDGGVSVPTGSSLDFMAEGPGYFTLQGAQGELYFTRDGSFSVSMENGSAYLVSAEGYYVLGADNQRIQIPGDASAVAADSAGNLSVNGAGFATLKLTSFANPSGLLDAGGNKFTATPAAGTATAGGGTIVRQGCLEGSNVDLSGEMTRLLRAQKSYSVLGSAIRTADEMESQANTMSK
jgi:flagellar basal-body rod protein FlgG